MANSLQNKRANRLLPALGNLLQMFAGGGDETAPAGLPPLSPNVNAPTPTNPVAATRLLPPLSPNVTAPTPTNPVNVIPQALTPEILPPLSAPPGLTRLSPDTTTSEQIGEISRQYDGRQFALDEPPTAPIAERILPPILAPSQQTQTQINAVNEKDYGKAQYDDQGRLIKARGKDRDNKWSLGEKILGGVLGFLENGAVGAITNATDRNFMEKRGDAQRLNRLLPQLGQQQKSEEFETAQAYKQAQTATIPVDDELKRLQIQNTAANQKGREKTAQRNFALRQLGMMKRYKRGENPEFDAKIESLEIEQPDFEPDKKIKPRYWDNKTGKLMTFDDNNATIPVITPGGAEIVNDSRKEVESGGYTVMPGAARSADAQVESSRVGAANKTGENQYDYQTTVTKTNSEIAGVKNRISRLQSSIAPLQAKLDAQTITKEEYDQLNSKTKELGDAEDKQVELQNYISKLPKPPPTAAVTGNNVGTYSETQFRQIFKDKTPQQLKTLVENARAQGIIK